MKRPSDAKRREGLVYESPSRKDRPKGGRSSSPTDQALVTKSPGLFYTRPNRAQRAKEQGTEGPTTRSGVKGLCSPARPWSPNLIVLTRGAPPLLFLHVIYVKLLTICTLTNWYQLPLLVYSHPFPVSSKAQASLPGASRLLSRTMSRAFKISLILKSRNGLPVYKDLAKLSDVELDDQVRAIVRRMRADESRSNRPDDPAPAHSGLNWSRPLYRNAVEKALRGTDRPEWSGSWSALLYTDKIIRDERPSPRGAFPEEAEQNEWRSVLVALGILFSIVLIVWAMS